MEQMRASLDPVLARHPNLTVSAKVASNHSKILRNDYRAIADAISGLTAALHPARTAERLVCQVRVWARSSRPESALGPLGRGAGRLLS
jgi:hypothetical protein